MTRAADLDLAGPTRRIDRSDRRPPARPIAATLDDDKRDPVAAQLAALAAALTPPTLTTGDKFKAWIGAHIPLILTTAIALALAVQDLRDEWRDASRFRDDAAKIHEAQSQTLRAIGDTLTQLRSDVHASHPPRYGATAPPLP